MRRPIQRDRSEPLLFCLAATFCYGAFTVTDPYNMRDGFFMGAAVEAYPFFLLTPVCSILAIYFSRLYPRLRLWGVAVLVLFLLSPLTRRFFDYWLRVLLPCVWGNPFIRTHS
jgi:hypothetical protein